MCLILVVVPLLVSFRLEMETGEYPLLSLCYLGTHVKTLGNAVERGVGYTPYGGKYILLVP